MVGNLNGVLLPVGYPILFIIYINDIGSGITSNISKFADETKIGLLLGQGKMPGHYKVGDIRWSSA